MEGLGQALRGLGPHFEALRQLLAGLAGWIAAPDVLADSAGWLGWLAGVARIPGHCPGVGNLGAKSLSRAEVGGDYVVLGPTSNHQQLAADSKIHKDAEGSRPCYNAICKHVHNLAAWWP